MGGAGGVHEEVVSVAIDRACNQSIGRSSPSMAGRPARDFVRQEVSGGEWCAIAGTTNGRMVRLRHHLRRAVELVPAGALWNVLGAQADPHQLLATSLLHTLPGSYLLKLRDERRSVHATDMANGKILGEWRLPEHKGRTWSALASGAAHLYLTSQSTSGDHAELWRFPVPEELRV